MNSFLITTVFILTFVACSHVAIGPRGYYSDKEKKFKHGIVLKKETTKTTSMYFDTKKAQKGKFLYENYCFSCHGKDGRGDGPNSAHSPRKPADIIALIDQTPNFSFYIHASRFKGQMPGWENVFTDEEVLQLEAYLKFMAREAKREQKKNGKNLIDSLLDLKL